MNYQKFFPGEIVTNKNTKYEKHSIDTSEIGFQCF